MSHCSAPAVGPSVSLLDLYNHKMVDFVKLVKGDYVPCAEDKATHRLVPTRWNTPPRPSSNIIKTMREEKTAPRLFALAVVAKPL